MIVAAKMAMITTTINTSTNVKPPRFRLFFDMTFVPYVWQTGCGLISPT
jgi:hypothetical protein